MNVARVLRENECSSAWVKPHGFRPRANVGRAQSGQILVDCVEVEIPSIACLSLDEVVEEKVPPFGTEHEIFEFRIDGSVGTRSVEVL